MGSTCIKGPKKNEPRGIASFSNEQQDDTMQDYNLYLKLGDTCRRNGRYLTAIYYYQKAKRNAKRRSDIQKVGNIYLMLGITYASIGRYIKSIAYYVKAKEIGETLGDERQEIRCCKGIGVSYFSLGKYKIALCNFVKGAEIAVNVADRVHEGDLSEWCGDCCREMGEYQRAITFYKDAKKASHEAGLEKQVKTVKKKLADASQKIRDHNKASNNSKKSQEIAIKEGVDEQERLSSYHKVTKDIDNKDERRKVQWRQSSQKHRPKFEALVKILQTEEPSEVTRIGTCRTCFKPEFAIGNGSDGTIVYIGLSDDGIEVAVKSIPINLSQQLGLNEKEILNCPNVKKEPHIVNYRFYTDSVDSRHAYLVLDLHEESLRDYVRQRSKDELNKNGPTIIRQILLGLEALHCGGEEILHRDLKPANVLVSSQGEMLLADFGISRKLTRGQTTWRSGPKGTEDWIAVESLPTCENDDDSSDEEINVRYKKQSDIQVTGMLFFYILMKGSHPYGTANYRRSNLSEGKPVNLSKLDDPVTKDLIGWMLQHDPKDRPAVQQCLRHPYLLTANEKFNLVSSVGNQPEVKPKSYDANSVVVQNLNADPSLPKPSWKPMIDVEVLSYLSKHRHYSDNMADLLRLIRNTAQHWHDETPPSSVQGKVGNPADFFLELFPTLPVVLHRIIRNEPDWNQREQLQHFFMSRRS